MNADDTVLLLNVEAERQKRAITKAQDEAYERAAVVCEAEVVDYEATKHPEDQAYNTATKHCAKAIRNLKSKP